MTSPTHGRRAAIASLAICVFAFSACDAPDSSPPPEKDAEPVDDSPVSSAAHAPPEGVAPAEGVAGAELVSPADPAGSAEDDDRSRSTPARSIKDGAFREVLRLGKLDSPPWEVFGKIEDVEEGADGGLYVLDSRYNVVRVFSADGEFLEEFGGGGDGPGEFSSPSGLAFIGPSDLLVADRRQRVSRFQRRGDAWEFLSSFRVDVAPWSICATDSTAIVQGALYGVENVMHGYDLRGEKLSSFGEMADVEDVIARETFSWGLVECSATAERILYAPYHLGRVSAFDLSGNVLWSTEIPGFRQVRHEYVPAVGATRFEWLTPEGTNQNVGLHAPAESAALLQVALQDTSRKHLDDYQRLTTYFLSPADGAILDSSIALPRVRSFSWPRFFVVDQLPFPRVKVYEIVEPPG